MGSQPKKASGCGVQRPPFWWGQADAPEHRHQNISAWLTQKAEELRCGDDYSELFADTETGMTSLLGWVNAMPRQAEDEDVRDPY